MAKKKVKIYTTTWCPYCVAAKEFLKQKKIEFKEINIEKDPAAAKKMVKISGQTGVPVIQIDKKVIVGFDVEKIKKALELED
ncbi:MAG: glutaredoxin family protein [Candidatus Aenigmatarchaeota archaeon]